MVTAMLDAIRHRGPDDSGEFVHDQVGFGMRRLSIIDLSQGRQPIWTARGTGIVFNGEIYNYRELRRELMQRGVQLKTQSDTEVIAQLYDLDGLSCIKRLEGMFAICLYDASSRQIHLVRDRLGKKPLYYGEIEGAFYFALSGKKGKETHTSIDSVTTFYIPSREELVTGIHQFIQSASLTPEELDLVLIGKCGDAELDHATEDISRVGYFYSRLGEEFVGFE
jgi:asparagine synthase (glutamine-hydrolysing)